MFQFTRFPSTALCVQAGMTGHDPSRVSPFGYPRIKARSTASRGFSQPPTSFIGIWRQGIHRWLFVAWDFFVLDARARSEVLNQRTRTRAVEGRRAQASGDGDLELSSSSGAALPRGRGRSGLTAGGRVLPQNGTVMPGAAGPGGATCARERRGVGVVDGPISQRST